MLFMSVWNLFFRKKIDDALDAWCGPGNRERERENVKFKPARKYAQSKRPKTIGWADAGDLVPPKRTILFTSTSTDSDETNVRLETNKYSNGNDLRVLVV